MQRSAAHGEKQRRTAGRSGGRGEGGETGGPKAEELGEETERHEAKGCGNQEPERLRGAQGRGEGAGRRGQPATQAFPERREQTGARRGSAGEGSLAGRADTKGPSRLGGGPGGAGPRAGGALRAGRRSGSRADQRL